MRGATPRAVIAAGPVLGVSTGRGESLAAVCVGDTAVGCVGLLVAMRVREKASVYVWKTTAVHMREKAVVRVGMMGAVLLSVGCRLYTHQGGR